MTKTELLTKIDHSWNAFNAYLMTLTPPQVTLPTDGAGWTAQDHIIHIADWENGILALLNKQNRAVAMGIDAATWSAPDFDKINDILQKRSRNKTLQEAQIYVMGIHQQLVDKVQSLTDDDLYRPYKAYQPDSDREEPVINWIQENSYEHYAEHTPWIAAIVAAYTPLSKAQLLSTIQKGWADLTAFLNTLSDTQKTQPTDAAGWTVKDHVIHLAAWEDGLVGLLDKQDRRTTMNIDEATWKSGDDAINAVIQQRYKDLSWTEVEQKRQAIHTKLLKQIDALNDETLQDAYGAYNSNSQSKHAITEYISATTFDHYAEHMLWMAVIANTHS